MFDFWKPRLTNVLIDSVKQDDGCLVHLATEEITRLFDWKRVKREVKVLEPQFFVRDGDKLKTIVVYAKMCRGAMTRYILRGIQLSTQSRPRESECITVCIGVNIPSPNLIQQQRLHRFMKKNS